MVEPYLLSRAVNCHCIKLLNIYDHSSILAFHDDQVNPSHMCHGKDGQLYCLNAVKGPSILELECFSSKFIIIGRHKTEIDSFDSMEYMPSEEAIVMSSVSERVICAISCKTAQVVWEVHNNFHGEEVDCFGVDFSVKRNVIIVCSNDKIILMNPKDGSVDQAINIPTMGRIERVCVDNNDDIVILHFVEGETKLSVYSINCFNT